MCSKKINMIGRRIGRLTVIEEVDKDKSGHTQYRCKCDCGNETIVRGYLLRGYKTLSCGCIRSEKSSERMLKHGYSKERAYAVWRGMKKRCYNPNHNAYKNYGARGIRVCDEWLNSYETFKKFLMDNGFDPEAKFGETTLDRIDNNKDYCPENCRIVPMKDQALNRSTNHIIEFNGQQMTITEASRLMKISSKHVFNRINKGWSIDKALRTPVRRVKTYFVNGEEHTIGEWSLILQITDPTLRGRLKSETMREIVCSIYPNFPNKE